MITHGEQARVFEKAYVPEHIIGLMTSISKGEPFLIEDYRVAFERPNPKPSLRRLADKTSRELSIERGHSISKEHQQLIK